MEITSKLKAEWESKYHEYELKLHESFENLKQA